MEDLIELYKKRDALAKENADASDITNIINENWVVKEPKPIILTHSYYENPNFYEHYDNYNAIEIPRVELIPYDYDGIMGVPLTFLGARNRIYIPDYSSIPKCNETPNFCINYLCSQFTIIGMSASAGYNKDIVGLPFVGEKDARCLVNGKNVYARIFVKFF